MFPTTLSEWLDYIESLHPKDIELGLARSRQVAAALNLKLSVPVITVGGTNGKGSTCAMLESILRADGYRVGLYIKPHFVRFNERARINSSEASDLDLMRQFEKVEAVRTATQPPIELTYYEFTTLAILNLFAESDLDVVILEVGLGGRLDTVNLIDADCSVVTSIDIDHTPNTWAIRARKLASRKPASSGQAGRQWSATRYRPNRSSITHKRSAPICGCRVVISTSQATSSSGILPPGVCGAMPFSIRRCAAPTSS